MRKAKNDKRTRADKPPAVDNSALYDEAAVRLRELIAVRNECAKELGLGVRPMAKLSLDDDPLNMAHDLMKLACAFSLMASACGQRMLRVEADEAELLACSLIKASGADTQDLSSVESMSVDSRRGLHSLIGDNAK